jgi:two-component system, sensor histidine kinase PhcS
LNLIYKKSQDFFNYRKDSNYLKELHNLMQFYNVRACFITAFLIVSGIGLDFFYYKKHLYDFFILRLLTALTIISSLFIVKTNFGQLYSKYIIYSWIIAPQIMISYMIANTGAENSIYFVGLTFALAGIAFILPISIISAVIFGAITIILYTIACLAGNEMPTGLTLNKFYGNLIFIIFFCFIAIAFSIYNEIWRWESFQLKKQLTLTNAELFKNNRSLTEIKGHMIQQEKMSALGTLSAGLLHELNNPVSYSMMAISMAEMEPEVKINPQLKESLIDSKEGMKRVADIVTDLKTFAYQKPGEILNRTFLFENSLRSALRLSSFELKDIELPQDLPIDTHVLGDEPALIGVLINLVTNAALALRKSGQTKPFIHTKAWHGVDSATGQSRLYVTVRDNGTGIKPENLTKVFEPFFTTRDVGQGLGLGLAVSYAIIQRHGSELTVTSEEGYWTQFAFDLPIRMEVNHV